ncbi:hypothetical protein LEN26_014925 [Aphanomyces euteiches]|nr:hypothetical protein LEN26_014925 [Aphanomyces euteiches]KAH9106045.1 hypothetical protein AeMF1_018227 [Aphanomyces euteiches]
MMIPSKRFTAAHKHLLAMKMCSEETAHTFSPSMSSEWRSKYLRKLHISKQGESPPPPQQPTTPAPSTSFSAPIMIPSTSDRNSWGRDERTSPVLSWERRSSFSMSTPSPPPPMDELDLDEVSMFPMGSPDEHDESASEQDEDEKQEDCVAFYDRHPADLTRTSDPMPIAGSRVRRRGFIPPHQLVQRDCFSLGVQHQFRKRPTAAI